MPKIKTNKAARNRFKITKKGKVLAASSFRRHLMTDRSSKRKRQSRHWKQAVDVTDIHRIKALLPYER